MVEQYFQTLSINLVFLALLRFKGKILPIPSLGDDAQDGEKEKSESVIHPELSHGQRCPCCLDD